MPTGPNADGLNADCRLGLQEKGHPDIGHFMPFACRHKYRHQTKLNELR